MLVAAALCPAPPLLARDLTGADPVIPELRRACLDAAAGLLDSQPDLIVVTGAGPETRQWDPAGHLDVAVFAPALRRAGPAPGQPPPAGVGLGAMLLDQAGYAGPRALQTVTQDEPAAGCAALGGRLAGLAPRVAILVMADGTARRTLKAPGYLDERAAPFDDTVTRMLTGTDLTALLGLDAGLAGELMATGRPAWQVLAGAARGLRASCEVRYRDDPFGVYYLVASIALAAAPVVALRPLEDRDLDLIFDQMRDPDSVHMAAFTAADPDDRAAFDAHMTMVTTSPDITWRAVTCDGKLAGHIASFVVDGDTEVTYWIGRQWWGKGVASRALELLLELVPARPLYARAASDNVASLRVLAKAGFVPAGREISLAPARGTHIEETILRRD
jgi:RimJ/RimL family protein N-acetyltransferase